MLTQRGVKQTQGTKRVWIFYEKKPRKKLTTRFSIDSSDFVAAILTNYFEHWRAANVRERFSYAHVTLYSDRKRKR